jgi:hypothetical protein
MRRLAFVITMSVLGGLGGFIGSVIGAGSGRTTLFIGGFAGGILIAPVSARLAVWRRWIAPAQYWPTTVGAAAGFVAAALVAINTLSSPVGPLLGTLLTGVGALVGNRFGQRAQGRNSKLP